MPLSDHDQTRVREYLLGRLTEEEQQKIEERLIVEDDLFEELEISKGELIEEYCAGELDQEEHRWFERHYLTSPEGRERHVFTLALDCLQPPTPVLTRSTLLNRLRAFFVNQRWALATVAAIALVAILIIGIKSSRPQPSLSVTLTSSGLNRSQGQGAYQKIQVKPDIGELRISLVLPENALPGGNYLVILEDRDRELKTLKPSASDKNSVEVTIPASQLPPSLYSLKLVSVSADGKEQTIVGHYSFEITN